MTVPCSRRALLRTGALGLVGAAGCTGNSGDGSPGNETSESSPVTTTGTAGKSVTDRTTNQTTAAAEPPLGVEDVRIQSSLFYSNYPDAAAVAGREFTQFVFVELALVGSLEHLPSPNEIALTTGDRDYSGTLAPGSTDGPWELHEAGQPYRVEPIQSGWVAFEVPAPLDTGEIALTYESNGRRFTERLDVEVVERLGRPPAEFEVASFDVPGSVGPGESFEISVAVENASEVGGTFRAVLNQSRPSYGYRLIELKVPADGRRKWSRTSDWNVHDGDEGQFTLLTPVGDYEATVAVASETSNG